MKTETVKQASKHTERKAQAMSNFSKDFWKPRLKNELCHWLAQHAPTPLWKWEKLSKKQLYAIYYQIRQREG